MVLKQGVKRLSYVLNQFCYQINRKTPRTIYLRCSTKCGATQTIDPQFENVFTHPGPRNHNGNEENISEMEFEQHLKKFNKGPTQFLKNVYDNVFTKTRNERSLPAYISVKSTMQRHRAKNYPHVL